MDRLMHRKQEVRTAVDDGAPVPAAPAPPPIAKKFEATAAASAEPVVIAGRAPSEPSKTPSASTPAAPPPERERDAPGGMNRLLEAKRRAMRDKQNQSDEEKKS
jgi:hypothetical protein